MQRVSVVGSSGAGKSLFGRQLAQRIGAPFIELDAIFHQPGWTPLPTAEFRDRVSEVVAGETWVIDGNYSVVRDLIWARADTAVWIDVPRRRVMSQLVRRTLSRIVRRTELWNGNKEDVRNLLSRDPNRNILLWAWTNHGKYAEQYARSHRDYPALDLIRVSSRARAVEILYSVNNPGSSTL